MAAVLIYSIAVVPPLSYLVVLLITKYLEYKVSCLADPHQSAKGLTMR